MLHIVPLFFKALQVLGWILTQTVRFKLILIRKLAIRFRFDYFRCM